MLLFEFIAYFVDLSAEFATKYFPLPAVNRYDPFL